MQAVEFPSEAFARAVLTSERQRIIGLLWALAGLLAVVAARLLLPG